MALGIDTGKALWIKFQLKNISDKSIDKILEFPNFRMEEITLYHNGQVFQEGIHHIAKGRESITPTFMITLDPSEEKIFYIRAYSKVDTLTAQLVLWRVDDYKEYDYRQKGFFIVFFTILFTLLIYNFMLLIFTKDSAYRAYIIYLVSVITFEAIYSGLAQIYLFSQELTIIVSKGALIYLAFLVLSIILFTIEFLHTHKFKRNHTLLVSYFYIFPVVAILGYDNFIFNLNVLIVLIPIGFITVGFAFYVLFKGERQARFYVLGWSFVIFSLLFGVLKAVGIYDITVYITYPTEIAFAFEALLFSIALAYRIRLNSEEKDIANQTLIDFQKEEQIRLENIVNEKTKDLTISLKEKDILYRELNHRVKNNIQIILSLVKLQISKTKIANVKDELITTKNRINSISQLYETLNLENIGLNIDTREYFQNIVETIKDYFSKDIVIDYNINSTLEINRLIYCGLILNELVTNSCKYASKDKIIITITLTRKDNIIYFIIEDNGIGFESKGSNSLGLEIVKTLVENQLQGTLDIESKNGTKITISWKEHG